MLNVILLLSSTKIENEVKSGGAQKCFKAFMCSFMGAHGISVLSKHTRDPTSIPETGVCSRPGVY